MSSNNSEESPNVPKGLKIKSPGNQSQGLKIVSHGNSDDKTHQLKIKTPGNKPKELKIKSNSNSETLKPIENLEQNLDPLATYVQHQETLYEIEEKKRKAIIEQEEKLRELEKLQEQRLKELEERLVEERKKLQQEKLKFEHAKQVEMQRIKDEEKFAREHDSEDEKRWIEYEEKTKKEEELKRQLDEVENEKLSIEQSPKESNENQPVESVDIDSETKKSEKQYTDTRTCRAKNPLKKELQSQNAIEELLKHSVDEDRETLLAMDEICEEDSSSEQMSSEEEIVIEEKNKNEGFKENNDQQKTFVQFDSDQDVSQSDEEFIEPDQSISLREESSGLSGGFTPSFYTIDEKGIRLTHIEEDDVIFNFGRGKNNECHINDNTISETQMRAVHFKGRWTFMDTGVRDALSFNGIKTRQLTTTSESRTAIKCGNSWIIHIGLNSSKYQETDTQLLQRSILNNIPQPYVDDACVTLSYRNKARSSTMAPILAGSHPCCDFKMEGLKPFHFIIYWSQVGLYIEDLTKGHPGVFLGDKRISGNTAITNTVSITAGKIRFDVVVTGTQDTHRQALADAHNKKQRLKLMPVSARLPPIILTPGLRNLIIGRNEESDLMIKDISVSRSHAKISIRDKSIMLQDLGSVNGTKVNLEKCNRSIVVPGDVVTLGNVSFLLCFEELSRANK